MFLLFPKISVQKHLITVSDTYSSYRSDVTILIDSLRNNLDKTDDERNNLYNRNIEMTSEISSYKNKIEYINIYKIKIKEVGFEMLQEINNNYFNNFKCFDLMKLYVEECRILFELKKKCFVLDFVDKINVTGLTNLLNQVFSSTEELYTTYNDKLLSFYSLYIENKKNLTEQYREWNNKTVEELNSKIMEKEKHLEEFQDNHKNEIFKYEIKIKNMKEEFEIELESHKKTIDQLKSRKNNSKNLYLTNIIENINVVNNIIADIQNDFLLIQASIRDTKIHENSIKNSLKLKNRIKYKNLREKYKKLKNKKNKKVKKISYPSESDIWDVFK